MLTLEVVFARVRDDDSAGEKLGLASAGERGQDDSLRLRESVSGRERDLRHPLRKGSRELAGRGSAAERESLESVRLVLSQRTVDKLLHHVGNTAAGEIAG